MEIAVIVVSAVLALFLVGAAAGQLRGNPVQLEALDAVNVPRRMIPVIAGLQLCAAAGLLAGLAWPVIGVAAATGTALMFVGAVGVHLRARNANVAPAVIVLGLAAAVIVLHLAPRIG